MQNMVEFFRRERFKVKKNYFVKLVKYAKKVLNIQKGLKGLKDGRQNPVYPTEQIVLVVLMGFLMRTRSFNNLNNMIKDDDFKYIVPRGMK